TSRPSLWSWARYTSPMPPAPSEQTISYAPNRVPADNSMDRLNAETLSTIATRGAPAPMNRTTRTPQEIIFRDGAARVWGTNGGRTSTPSTSTTTATSGSRGRWLRDPPGDRARCGYRQVQTHVGRLRQDAGRQRAQ